MLEDGLPDRAAVDLAEPARRPELADAHCQMIAELLAERDDPASAASWYDRAVARLEDRHLAELRRPEAGWSLAATMVRGRREVRERLGLPPDATDELVPEPRPRRLARRPRPFARSAAGHRRSWCGPFPGLDCFDPAR